ncbi:hypothetical protein [Alkalisalibacterium limincola]|uniref:DUF3784 domain-containing protein n=1 Tax=Alkalisalibacterium limincola TaxID=2699169 RepID=A0A5C8KH00_9GAMM|nr:hypothetical protein [Alkalisalibacterium limincola]TXK59069.1 hypothetical protein FU658_14080 [Alkalisalibacterium limincola]
MLILLGICLIGLSVLLLVLALAVRFAGESKPLNMVDYTRVGDPGALHRAVGNRMFLLPALMAAIAGAALHSPQAFLIVGGVGTMLLIAAFAWILHVASTLQRSV